MTRIISYYPVPILYRAYSTVYLVNIVEQTGIPAYRVVNTAVCR